MHHISYVGYFNFTINDTFTTTLVIIYGKFYFYIYKNCSNRLGVVNKTEPLEKILIEYSENVK